MSTPLDPAALWELRCWDERVKNAQLVLGVMEGEREQARRRILAEAGVPEGVPYTIDDAGIVTVLAPQEPPR